MGELSDAEIAFGAVGVISAGIGLLLLAAEHLTRTSVALAGVYVLVGISLPISMSLRDQVDPESPGLVARLVPFLEGAATVSAALYLLAILASSSAGAAARRRIRSVMVAVMVLGAWLTVLGVALPAERSNDFQGAILEAASWRNPGFLVFLLSWVAVAAAFVAGYLLLSRERLDGGERTRARSAAVGATLLISTLMLPWEVGFGTGCVSMLTALYGQVRFVAAQAERGVFLTRFLSPQVAELVRIEGLESVARAQEVELTAVACDLRGFTAYAEAVPSQAVIDLLSEYYEAVGNAVAEANGTVKDYAGDGVLVLVGAPLPRQDHAAAGLALAHQLLRVTQPVLDRWATPLHPLGIGVGVASGRVTVGAIGSTGRLEYTAVGTAVNLAARLCSRAADGEVLVDGHTLSAAPGAGPAVSIGSIELKGLSSAREVFRSSPVSDSS